MPCVCGERLALQLLGLGTLAERQQRRGQIGLLNAYPWVLGSHDARDVCQKLAYRWRRFGVFILAHEIPRKLTPQLERIRMLGAV
jgi:hypothetical protein